MKDYRITALTLLIAAALTGCGSSDYLVGSVADNSYDDGYNSYNSYDSYAAAEAEDAWDDSGYDYETDSGEYGEYEEDYDDDAKLSVEGSNTTASSAAAINEEKLVYYCNISIDTLDYEESLVKLKALLKQYDGFLESEAYSDGNDYSYSYYYVDSYSKNRTYSATFRVPTTSYEAILADMEEIGDVRSKDANVENLTQEYSDLSITLDVLQQTYDRYSALMESASDEEYILAIQEKLTDTQIRIESVKSRMNTINRDVAYSTIEVRLREVREYTEEPMPRDTFAQRLVSTISDSWEVFLGFLEGLLFLIIRLLPFAVLALVIWLIVRFIMIKLGFTKEKRLARKAARAEKKRKQQEENARRAEAYRQQKYGQSQNDDINKD